MPESKNLHTTITVRTETKARLARIKGPSRSWDAFFLGLLEDYPAEEELKLLEERLEEMRSGSAEWVPWEEVKARAREKRRRDGTEGVRFRDVEHDI